MKKIIPFLIIICTVFFVGCSVKPKQQLYILAPTDCINGDVLTAFEKDYNVDIEYNNYTNPEDIYADLTANPNKYDIVIAPNYVTSRLIEEGSLLALDKTKITNYNNIMDGFTPNTNYTFPYMYGTLGILYDANKVTTKIDSWTALWDKTYKGEIIMTDVERDAISIAFKSMGFDINDKDQSHINFAQDRLSEQLQIVQSWQNINMPDNMAWGRAILAAATSNQAEMAVEKASETGYANLKYVIPSEGSVRFLYSLAILKGSQNSDLALKFIDNVSFADNSAKNSEASGLTSPITGARNLLPDNMKNSTIMYPTDAQLLTCKYNDYDVVAGQQYDIIWRIINASITRK